MGKVLPREDSLHPGGHSVYLGGLTLPGRTLSTWEDSLSLPGRTHYLGRLPVSAWEDSLYCALGGILPLAAPCWSCFLESPFSLLPSSIQDGVGAIDEERTGMGSGCSPTDSETVARGEGREDSMTGVMGKVWRGQRGGGPAGTEAKKELERGRHGAAGSPWEVENPLSWAQENHVNMQRQLVPHKSFHSLWAVWILGKCPLPPIPHCCHPTRPAPCFAEPTPTPVPGVHRPGPPSQVSI